jgi:hypothetical protein
MSSDKHTPPQNDSSKTAHGGAQADRNSPTGHHLPPRGDEPAMDDTDRNSDQIITPDK